MEKIKLNFQKTFEVHSYEAFYNRQLKPVKLFEYLNDTAEHHSESVGFSMENLFFKGCSWILLSWNICIEKWPSLRDVILIETWISHIKRCFAFREFLVKNSQNEILIRASSRWIFYHIGKKRAERIPEKLVNQWPTNRSVACPESIIDSANLKTQGSQKIENSFIVQKQDIDILDHVHNTRYIDWIMQNKPEEIRQNYSLKHIDVSYRHEIKFPNDVLIKQSISSSLKNLEEIVYICDEIMTPDKPELASLIVSKWELPHNPYFL